MTMRLIRHTSGNHSCRGATLQTCRPSHDAGVTFYALCPWSSSPEQEPERAGTAVLAVNGGHWAVSCPCPLLRPHPQWRVTGVGLCGAVSGWYDTTKPGVHSHIHPCNAPCGRSRTRCTQEAERRGEVHEKRTPVAGSTGYGNVGTAAAPSLSLA